MSARRSRSPRLILSTAVWVVAWPVLSLAQVPVSGVEDRTILLSSDRQVDTDKTERDERGRLEELQREIAVLEARIAVHKAEMAEIEARIRAAQARKLLKELESGRPHPSRESANTRTPRPREDRSASMPAEAPNVAPRAVRIAPDEDPQNQPLLEALDRKLEFPFPDKTPLGDVLRYICASTRGPGLPRGIPLFVDPVGLQGANVTLDSEVRLKSDALPIKEALKRILTQVGLTYSVSDGMLTITAPEKPAAK